MLLAWPSGGGYVNLRYFLPEPLKARALDFVQVFPVDDGDEQPVVNDQVEVWDQSIAQSRPVHFASDGTALVPAPMPGEMLPTADYAGDPFLGLPSPLEE